MDDSIDRAQKARASSPFLTAKYAAFYLGIGYDTLKRLRRSGKGPPCRQHGTTWRYHIEDLDRWSAARTAGGDHD